MNREQKAKIELDNAEERLRKSGLYEKAIIDIATKGAPLFGDIMIYQNKLEKSLIINIFKISMVEKLIFQKM